MVALPHQARRHLDQVVQRSLRDKVFFADAFFGKQLVPWQQAAINMGGRYRVKRAGRRTGKSMTTVINCVHRCLLRPNTVGYVTGPSIDQTGLYFAEIEEAAQQNQLLEACIQRSASGQLWQRSPFPELRFTNGSRMLGRSTARQGLYLRGKGADWVAITEAAWITDAIYNNVVRAMVLDRQGDIDLESTPNGDNYFKAVDERANLPMPDGWCRTSRNGRYRSVYATVYDNPRLSAEDIEDIRQDLPEWAFDVEYLAKYISDDDKVFTWELLAELFDYDYQSGYDLYTTDAQGNIAAHPLPGHSYSIGVDLGQINDPTSISVLDYSRPPYYLAEWHRYKGKPYTGRGSVAEHVNQVKAKYPNAPVYVDATNERAVAENIIGANPIVFTEVVRNAMLSDFQVLCQHRRLALPAGYTTLRDEMRYLQRVRTRGGLRVRIDHPTGRHDDTVFSLAMACMAAPMPAAPAATQPEAVVALVGSRFR